MTDTTNTTRLGQTAKTRLRNAVVVLIAIVLVVGLVGSAQGQGDTASDLPEAGTVQLGDDLGAEEWWTTTDCPAGVEVPCTDLGIDPGTYLSAAELAQAADVDWWCIDSLGYHGDSIAPTATDLDLCRRTGIAAALTTR